MSESEKRFTGCTDLHLILFDGERRVLLGERQGTGWMDGSWHLPAGHLEDKESATVGTAREAKEELGIIVRPEDLKLAHVMHHRTDSSRTALFFGASTWLGEIQNTEPDKCAGWEWFSLDELPPTVPYAAEALRHIVQGRLYSERGWETQS